VKVVSMEKGEAGRVFISYRRQDTAWPARQLYDLLVAELGADRVFKDVDNIEPGDDFVERIQSAVGSCEVLLALIGPQWLTITDSRGTRRLDDPQDFVRIEVETALTRDDVRVIPILVDNAKMPSPHELPQGLATLTRRQAVEIDPVNFDTRRLLRVLSDTLKAARAEPAAPSIHAAAPRVQPSGTQPPVPPVKSAVAAAPSDKPPSGAGGAGRDQASDVQPERGRRRVGLLVALATSIVLLVAVGGAVWYLPRDRNQATPTGQANSASVSSPPPANAPTSSPSKTKAAEESTGSNILAHRGGDEKYPLQTFESLTSAADDGFAVETDVRWTSDNHAVIIHDEAATQGLRCDRPYQVSKTTWKVLSEHCRSFRKNGKSYPPSTYATVMEGLASYDSWVYVEVKVDQNAAQDKEFVDVIRSNGLSDRTVVTSNSLDRLGKIKKLAPDLPRMLFVGEQVPVTELDHEKLWAIAVNYDVATKDYIKQLQKAGLVVIVWTVNEEQAWAETKSIGADKVLTDKPRAYKAWLAKQ
jgi:glycerophosphoryl diester phosphodiesterase